MGMIMKKRTVKIFLKSFLTAYALSAVFHVPLIPSSYETGLDFVIASVYELLGEYDLKFFLLLLLGLGFYGFHSGKSAETPSSRDGSPGLAVFFALCLTIGQSYHQAGNASCCLGSVVNLLKFTLALTGFSLLFCRLIRLGYFFLESRCFTADETHFFTRHPFRKAFLILSAAYLPLLILSFPGNLCWDAIGQIEQVMGSAPYSTHHPLLHTLIMGGFIKGGSLLGSPEAGLFLYMLFQDILLISTLAATIALLSRRGAGLRLLVFLLTIYCITPVYSNMASTAVKDVPYTAFTLGYTMALALFLEKPARLKDRKFLLLFFLLQIGVILFRNNGLYVVLLSGIGCFAFLSRNYKSVREKLCCLFTAFGGSILTAQLILFLLVQTTSAASGSLGEMLSIPFQQTARYLQFYREEIDPEERAGIEAVLGDVETVAASYNPASADPVKALYRRDTSGAELAAYFRAWFRGLFRHPGAYFDAFFVHIYGWFTPSVSNSIRYETDGYETVRQGGLFPNADKLLIFYYRFANRITLLGLLENIGAAVWGLFFLTFYQKRQGRTGAVLAGLPLWISLLICMASPCFFGHPRYAFPILFALPFLYGFTLTTSPSRDSKELSATVPKTEK